MSTNSWGLGGASPVGQYRHGRCPTVEGRGLASELAYHANGALASVQHTNGLTDSMGLDPNWIERPSGLITAPTAGGAPLWQRGERYKQTRDWGQTDSKTKRREFPKEDVDHTDHGRPDNHDNPRRHIYDPKNGKRGDPEPVKSPNDKRHK